MVVAELIDWNLGRWDLEQIRDLFDEESVVAIQKIPIPRSPLEDRVVWVGGKTQHTGWTNQEDSNKIEMKSGRNYGKLRYMRVENTIVENCCGDFASQSRTWSQA